MNNKFSRSALVLPGGGARGAYQIGVLKAISEFSPEGHCPFDIFTGTSVGAINAVSAASHAHDFKRGILGVESLWAGLRAGRIYRTDFPTFLKTVFHWLSALMVMGEGKYNPVALLDNAPLGDLLTKEINFRGLTRNIENGVIRAAAVSASSYAVGRAVTFFQAKKNIKPWRRARRVGKPDQLTVDHLMASSALPFMFFPRRIGNEYFGDGSLRHNAPLGPAVHLGARRILIIGIRDQKPDQVKKEKPVRPPSLGEIAGHMLDIIFSDNLDADCERLCRINQTLSLMTDKEREKTPLKHIDIMQVHPSRDLRQITARYAHELPWTVKMLLKGVGGWAGDWRLPSFLLFETGFIRELIDLGYRDAKKRQKDLENFLKLTPQSLKGLPQDKCKVLRA